jgi:hypothetical protein
MIFSTSCASGFVSHGLISFYKKFLFLIRYLRSDIGNLNKHATSVLELELIQIQQTRMIQIPLLWAEVGKGV